MSYIKEIFDVDTFEHAKHVVLTTDPNNPDKFQKETKFLVDSIQSYMILTDTSTVLDFGCGMGRVAKEMITRFNCKIFGLDISPSMLMFAKLYTANMNKFLGTHSYTESNSIDMAMSILALQHSENPQEEIDNIVTVLKPNGIFVLLNEEKRFVPSEIDPNNFIIWNDDGFNIFDYVEARLEKVHSVPYLNSGKNIIFYRKPE